MKVIKTLLAFFVLAIGMLGASSAIADVAGCKHDVAPFDQGRYSRDMAAGKVVSTTTVPVGTVWETNMKGGRWITCRTTQVRTVAILANNTYYDIDCGNEVKIALPPKDVKVVVDTQPSISTIQSAPVCKGEEECKLFRWCDENNGWKSAGVDENGRAVRKCSVPGTVSLIDQLDEIRVQKHTKISGSQTAEFTGWGQAPVVNVPAAPPVQVNIARSQAPVVTGQSCYTQGCSSRPVANFVSEVKASFCGIRTTDGHLLVIRDQNNMMQIVLDPIIRNGVPDFSNNPRAETFRQVRMSDFAGNCDAAQEVVEKQGWPRITQVFGLQNACQPADRIRGQFSR